VKILLANIDYWARAPVWTPESIGEATKEWFSYLGKTSKKAEGRRQKSEVKSNKSVPRLHSGSPARR